MLARQIGVPNFIAIFSSFFCCYQLRMLFLLFQESSLFSQAALKLQLLLDCDFKTDSKKFDRLVQMSRNAENDLNSFDFLLVFNQKAPK